MSRTATTSSLSSVATAWLWLRERLRRHRLRLRRELHARRAIEELTALDDRMLADIGLDRGSIGFAARYGHLSAEHAPLGLRSSTAMPTATQQRTPSRSPA
ncbi:MAG TPA: DUF1127 domain-containing protein [Kiloniellales bacterium]|nr:DUF1127 domain-containing protein [Kiloniellales bacterium]